MSKWITTPLEELADISSGGTPSRAVDDFWGGDILWVTPSDITRCKTNYLDDTKECITEKGLLSSSAKLLPAGTLLLTSRATIGEIKISSKQASTNQGFKNLIPKDCIDTDFLFYKIVQLKNEFIKYSAGSTFFEINRKDTGRILISHPLNKNVQKKIGIILKAIDRTIAKTKALIEKYQQIKTGLMYDLFTRGIGADGKLRPSREEAPELYRESAIGWIPKEWDCSPLKTKSKSGTPHLKTGPFGSSLKGEHWVNDGVPVITIGSLGEGEFDVTELLFVNNFDANRLYDFQMKLGDVVFSRVADVGRSVVIDRSQVGWIMSSNLMRISLDKSLVQSNYLQYQLSYDFRIKKQIRCKVNSGGRDVANSEVLNSLFFAWAKIDEQLEIVKRAKVITSLINCESDKLQKLHTEKSGLMHDLLTGKVSVNVDAAEVACE